jgi:maleate isomerase
MVIRLGVILPSCNTLLETELCSLPINGVSFHFTRVVCCSDEEEELAAMADQAPNAAELLSHAKVHAIAFGCTAGSFLYGKGYDLKLIKKMASRVTVPCITTSTAVIKGLREMKINRVMLLTPYEQWLTQRGFEFLKANNFEVIGSEHLNFTDSHNLVDKTSEQIVEWAKTKIRPNCDGVFISCTNFRGMGAAEQLEKDLGIPVVTSNQATVWYLLQLSGYKSPVTGYGALLQRL